MDFKELDELLIEYYRAKAKQKLGTLQKALDENLEKKRLYEQIEKANADMDEVYKQMIRDQRKFVFNEWMNAKKKAEE